MTIRLLSYLARQMLEAWLESLIFYWLMASKERKMLFLANCLSLALREREREREKREKKIKNTSYVKDVKLLLQQYVNEDHPSNVPY